MPLQHVKRGGGGMKTQKNTIFLLTVKWKTQLMELIIPNISS